MNVGKALVVVLLFLTAAGLVSSYEFTGGAKDTGTSPPDSPAQPSACLDGNDNDGDGLVDGEGADSDNDGTPNWQEAGASGPDPGCSPPYEYDNSEANIYDLDASWVFGQYLSSPTEDDSSIFYGAEVIQNGSSVTVSPDQVLDTDQINETYVEGSNDWAAGVLRGETISISESRHEGNMPGSTTTAVEDGSAELIDAPHDDTTTGDGSQCGDAVRGGDENNLDCPEDYGLPDDAGTTKSQSSETLSDRFNSNIGQWDANNANGVSIGDSNNNANNGEYLNSKNSNDDTDDTIEYKFSNSGSGLIAPEAQGQKTDDISGSDPYTADLQSGTQADAGEVDDQVVQDQEWEDVPDYYLKDDDGDSVPDELWMVYPEKVGESYIGSSESDASVTDYDLTGDKNVETWGEDGGSVDQCSGANCSGTGTEKCTSIDQDTDTKYTLKSETTTTVSTNDNEQYYADSSGSHQHSKESTNLNQLSVEVTHHPGYETEQVDDDSCLSETEEESCDSSIGCSDSPSVDTVGPISNQDIATGQTSNTITYRYEDLELHTEKVFDLNPAENPSYAPMFPTDALFEGDTFKYGDEAYTRSNIKYNAFNGDSYYAYAVDTDNNMLGNDEAISSSSYHMRVDGDAFESVRDYFQSWDVDGPQGQSDGYMAILQRRGYLGNGQVEIQGVSNRFMNTETNSGGAMDIVQPADALGHVSINTNGCGDPFTHCVGALDIRPRNINNWDNPTDPSYQAGSQAYPTAVTFESNIQDTNQSLGVCKMFQELDPDAAIGSNYGSDSDSPTQSSDKRCAGDTTEEFWIAMEGPEVNEGPIKSHHLEGTADRVTDCLWYGEDVPEGTVRTVGTEAYSDYEEGGYSPDKEVCLAIDSSGESFTQDGIVYEETLPADDPGDDVTYDNYDYDDDGTVEEVGGEWYDLDNERVNEYLRSSGNGHDLIDSSQRGDPDNASQIAFYWRQNENPYHPDYNPKGQGSGENIGVTLEDNCGPLLTGCDDQETQTEGKTPVFFSFFWQLVGYQ
ncbi:hypothetical protein [Candidatus Nanohalovita haloferacivicina]|uniref:hypothetical protein n=1 Tax=Candidatus Nanohalovita haloferacivicina TaxID=2978046 RepID=UPI00325FD4AC|nr:hypothetical protein HBNXNv_0668 [Candidatus Nanohalobia archaeon BNXNv]